MNPPPTRILLVDDHFMVRHGLSAILSQQPDFEVIGQAANGAEALELFTRIQPDIVLMDGVLPDMHGIEVTRRIIATHPEARIIILSVNDTEEDIHQAMEAGACGYMPKSSEEDETIHAIRHVSAGHDFLPPHLAHKLAERNLHTSLSERETEVLQLTAEGKTNKEVAAASGLRESSVKTYLARIFTPSLEPPIAPRPSPSPASAAFSAADVHWRKHLPVLHLGDNGRLYRHRCPD